MVISFYNPVIGFAALFKKFRLINKVRLYTFVHHLGNRPQLYSGYDKIFFLSEILMEEAKRRYPNLAEKMVYLEWGPDMPFYEETYKTLSNKVCPDKPVVISNGKTARDIKLLESACEELDIPSIVVTDSLKSKSANIVTSGKKGRNAITYVELMKYMSQSDISVIPIVKRKEKANLCGLTSFLDALALGQPIVMSDNTNISVDIEGLGMGKLYKADDKEDLKAKLKFFVDHPERIREYGDRARAYALKHTYLDSCKHLEQFISKR